MSAKTVLDSFALVCLFQQEPGFQQVKDVLSRASQTADKAFFNIVNWGEFYYIVHRRLGKAKAEASLELIAQMPIEIVPADHALVKRAAEIKARYPLSYADAFAVATAIAYNASVLTDDPEFHAVEDVIAVKWLVKV